MKNGFEIFQSLHHQAEPLLIGNVWNVQSAKAFEKEGFSALATSSASVAETLGYEDGQEMSFDEYLFVVKHLTQFTNVPLSVDLEGGYANTPEDIARNIQSLYNVGVCGVNLEDSILINGQRSIENAVTFAHKITEIIKRLNESNARVFINIRCDAFLMGLPNTLEEAISRTKIYQTTGAHGLFMPCITSIEDIKKLCAISTLPVNVMCMPGLPNFDQLKDAGVKRISMGPFLSRNIYKKLESAVQQIVKDRSFESLFQ